MKHFINLIEYLESNHHYAQVDEMIKTALDMSDVLTEDNKLGKGLYGEFHSDFSSEEKQKLKNQLGNLPDNVGVKKFKEKQYNPITVTNNPITVTTDNIAENLAFIYIAPYINKNTDLVTPIYNGTISLSAMITNRINITQKMPGLTFKTVFEELKSIYPYFPPDVLDVSIENQIRDKLRAIGVDCYDIHSKNYLLNKSTVNEFFTWVKNNPYDATVFDLSKNAALFDFGDFIIHRSAPPGQQLEALKRKMESQNNKFMEVIVKAINRILI